MSVNEAVAQPAATAAAAAERTTCNDRAGRLILAATANHGVRRARKRLTATTLPAARGARRRGRRDPGPPRPARAAACRSRTCRALPRGSRLAKLRLVDPSEPKVDILRRSG